MALEHTFALVKTGAYDRMQLSQIKAAIADAGLTIEPGPRPFGTRIFQRDLAKFEELYQEHRDRPYYKELLASVSPMSWALILTGEDAVARWRALMGPTDPIKARLEAPDSLRAQFGGEALPDNAVHGSDSRAAAQWEATIFSPRIAASLEWPA